MLVPHCIIFGRRDALRASRTTREGRPALTGLVVAGFCAMLISCPTPLFGRDAPSSKREPGRPVSTLYATRPPALFVHNAGEFHVMVTNMGTIGDPRTGLDVYGGRWRGGEYLHSLELWVGAKGADDLFYVSNGYEFRPSLDPLETIYTSYEGAAGGRREGMTRFGGDDDGDGVADEEFLNGKDDDGDGLVDEDYAAIAQQMFCCEYRDDTQEAIDAMRDHHPMHLWVRQTTMAWSTEEENEFIGIRYEIQNAGYEILEDVYVGFVLDADVGLKDAAAYWEDDRAWVVALDTTVVDEQVYYDFHYECQDREGRWHDCRRRDIHLDLACMGDVPRRHGGIGGDDPPPESNGQIGLLLLSHTTDPRGLRAPSVVAPHTATHFRKRYWLDLEDFSRYNLLAQGARGPDSSVVPADLVCIVSVGPFPELLPGETVEVDLALIVGHERSGLLRNAMRAEQVHHGKWRNLDGLSETGCDGRETCLHVEPGEESYYWTDPCIPLSQPRLVKNTDCLSADYFVDDDCDCCTPYQIHYYFCDGRESLVPWVGRIAPPPPTISTDEPGHRARLEGDRRIFLEWDNAPELVADPQSGRIPFCGYRIWRVEGWERPLGSHGPAPEEWQRIAELVPHPVGAQLDLADYTNPDAAIVEHVPSPVTPGEWLDRYEVGRYFYTDTTGLKNGMLYFYDVTSFGCWWTGGNYHENGQPPAALEGDGVRPRWDAVAAASWQSAITVIPNPYRGGAAWDLIPSSADPLGTHIEFVGLPDEPCDIRIYSLAGDLVRKLHHEPAAGRGCLSWNLLSRNNQDVVSGVYLYAVTCGGKTVVGRCTIVR
ncbi:MAG: hypothetical protein KAY32_09185 [Candidatus Eisenbacteria sp.]|nr:hypothetical protein [Candidatus Eisenbacteria bacterium]